MTLTIKDHAAFPDSKHFNNVTAKVTTTNADLTAIYSFPAVPQSVVIGAEVYVVGYDTSDTERCTYKDCLLIRGTAAGGAATRDRVHTDETSAGLNASYATSSDVCTLSVTGLAATTINWAVYIRYQRVDEEA